MHNRKQRRSRIRSRRRRLLFALSDFKSKKRFIKNAGAASPLPIIPPLCFHLRLALGNFLPAALGAIVLLFLPTLELRTLPLLPVNLRLPDHD